MANNNNNSNNDQMGVFELPDGKWKACIRMLDNTIMRLGTFDDKKTAEERFLKAINKLGSRVQRTGQSIENQNSASNNSPRSALPKISQNSLFVGPENPILSGDKIAFPKTNTEIKEVTTTAVPQSNQTAALHSSPLNNKPENASSSLEQAISSVPPNRFENTPTVIDLNQSIPASFPGSLFVGKAPKYRLLSVDAFEVFVFDFPGWFSTTCSPD